MQMRTQNILQERSQLSPRALLALKEVSDFQKTLCVRWELDSCSFVGWVVKGEEGKPSVKIWIDLVHVCVLNN